MFIIEAIPVAKSLFICLVDSKGVLIKNYMLNFSFLLHEKYALKLL